MKTFLWLLGIAIFLTGCDVEKNVNDTADTINQAADTMNEMAAKTTKIVDVVQDGVDKAEAVKDQVKDELTELQSSWDVIKTEVTENVETTTETLMDLKIKLEEVLGTSLVDLESVGTDILVKLNGGGIFKLDLLKTLDPQIEQLKVILAPQ